MKALELRFTPAALAELDDVISFVAARSPGGALTVAARIRSVTTLLTGQPRLGRRTSNARLRSTTAVPYPYRVFYEVTDAEVIVAAFRLATRRPCRPGTDTRAPAALTPADPPGMSRPCCSSSPTR